MDKWMAANRRKWMELEGEMEGIPTNEIAVDATILGLVGEIDEFKGAWALVGRLAPDRLTSLRRVATVESVGSSTRIEGAKLSDKEVGRLLSNLETTRLASRDEREVAGYARAMEMIFESWEEIALTENHIKQLHSELLKDSSKDDRHRGQYKKVENHVEAFEDGKSVGVILHTASPLQTPHLMEDLVAWTQGQLEAKRLHSLVFIAIFIVVFLEIHPFQDGNGRLSRILTTLLLLRAGYVYVPYSSLERVIEENKEAYYLALYQTQRTLRTGNPDWRPWMHFFFEALHQQMKGLEKKIAEERRVFGKLPDLSVRILELCRERGKVSVGDVEKVTGANRSTIKDHMKALVRDGHLHLRGEGRGSFYTIA